MYILSINQDTFVYKAVPKHTKKQAGDCTPPSRVHAWTDAAHKAAGTKGSNRMVIRRASAILAAAGVMAFLAGCANAPIPVAENFEITSQKKVRSAGHWNLLARDVVAQTHGSLKQLGAAQQQPLYVALPQKPSTFDRAFRDFLITQMVQSGLTVSTQKSGAWAVEYETILVRHNSDRPHFVPGAYTAITAGLMASYGLRNAHADALRVAAVAGAAGLDYASSLWTGGPTNTELLLTTTITNGEQYLVRKSDVYYLEQVDAPLFLAAVANIPAVNFKVVDK